MADEQTFRDATPWTPPFVHVAEHAKACRLQNAREAAAFLLGWRANHLRRLIEEGTPPDWPDDAEPGLFHARVTEDQAAAVSAMLVQVGASVGLYSTAGERGDDPGMTLRIW